MGCAGELRHDQAHRDEPVAQGSRQGPDADEGRKAAWDAEFRACIFTSANAA
jgi:hypothetical protein